MIEIVMPFNLMPDSNKRLDTEYWFSHQACLPHLEDWCYTPFLLEHLTLCHTKLNLISSNHHSFCIFSTYSSFFFHCDSMSRFRIFFPTYLPFIYSRVVNFFAAFPVYLYLSMAINFLSPYLNSHFTSPTTPSSRKP